MSTRALFIIRDPDERTLATLYIHGDGYPEGVPYMLLKAFIDRELVNGYSDPYTEINGPESYAAMIVAYAVNINTKFTNKWHDKEGCLKTYFEDMPTGWIYLCSEDGMYDVDYTYIVNITEMTGKT